MRTTVNSKAICIDLDKPARKPKVGKLETLYLNAEEQSRFETIWRWLSDRGYEPTAEMVLKYCLSYTYVNKFAIVDSPLWND